MENHIKKGELGIEGKSFLASSLYSILEQHKSNLRILLLTCVNRDHLWILRKDWIFAFFSSKWPKSSFSTHKTQEQKDPTIEG